MMANPEHIEILKSGVEKWNEWRDSRMIFADLSGADLNGRDLGEADLGNANLSDTNLRGAQLERTHFATSVVERADLREAKLFGANMIFTQLANVDLREADLGQARLINCNLTDANLSGTDLRETLLSGVKMDRTNLNESLLLETIFRKVDLSTVLGLDACQHLGPSVIDHTTIAGSSRLPDEFLRGCGLPDVLINSLQGMFRNNPVEFYSCFISYSHEDKAFARRLHDALQGRGIRCWLDEKQILPGDDVYDQIDRGIRMWDKVILCCSKNSLSSWWVDQELEKAVKKEERLYKERGEKKLALIPLNLDGYLFEWEHPKSTLVTGRHAQDFTGWEKNNAIFEENIERVIEALNTKVAAHREAPESKI